MINQPLSPFNNGLKDAVAGKPENNTYHKETHDYVSYKDGYMSGAMTKEGHVSSDMYDIWNGLD